MRSRKYLLALAALVVVLGLIVYRTLLTVSPAPAVASFAGVSLRLDLATTTATRERGLGGRIDLPDDYGMLFVFAKADRYGFWMKDTLVPLDIFWLDAQGQVVWMQEQVRPDSYPAVFYPKTSALYVLETMAGFGRAHGVATGTPLKLQSFPTVLE